MIDRVTSHIPDAKRGFIMVFSGTPFPDYHIRLKWKRQEGTGNIYHSDELDADGWLCPALLRYFDDRPCELFVQVKPKAGSS